MKMPGCLKMPVSATMLAALACGMLLKVPALPPARTGTMEIMYGKEYVLTGETPEGAGIYAAPDGRNDRARDYVIAAIKEAGIDGSMDDYEKIHAINGYLCQKLSYDDQAAEDPLTYKKDWLPYTDYCLLSDRAVCAGYAEAFQSMCCALGIECWYVTGYLNGLYHAWNSVIIDGRKYYIDVLLNDGTENAYFLSETGWADHEVEKEHETYRISSQKFPMPMAR